MISSPNSNSFSNREPRIPAFTIVELLVVVTIVALLLTVLLPSFKKVRELALMIKCSSGVRQVGIAHQIYMQDSKQAMLATGYVTVGDGWYDRLVQNGYADKQLFYNKGGCPYSPTTYQLGDNWDPFYGHGNPASHSSYAINAAMVGMLDGTTHAWSVSDWNGVNYTSKGMTNAKQDRYKRYQKWPADIMLFHCSTIPESTNYGLYGLNYRYTLGVVTGTWVVVPLLTKYARHDGVAAPMSFSDLHIEQVKPSFWITDTSREIRWKSMANYNKPEYLNSGAYSGPDL